MNKTYFNYLRKSNKFLFAVLFVGVIMINLIPDFKSRINFLSYAVIVLSLISPLYFLSYIHRKEEVSLFNSFPIKKIELWKTRFWYSNYLVIILIIITLLLNFIVTILIYHEDYYSMMNLMMRIVIVFVSLVILNMMNQVISMWVIERCNNLFDSIISIAAYVILPYVTMLTLQYFIGMNSLLIDNIFDYVTRFILSPMSLPVEIINRLNNSYGEVILIKDFHTFNLVIFSFVIWVIISMYLYRNAMLRVKNHTVEQAEQKSSSIWITIVPVVWITILFLLVLIGTNSIVLLTIAFILVLYFGGLSIYQRKIAISKKTALLLVAMIVSVGLFRFVFLKTEAFGLDQMIINQNYITGIQLETGNNSIDYGLEVWNVDTLDNELSKITEEIIRKEIDMFYINKDKKIINATVFIHMKVYSGYRLLEEFQISKESYDKLTTIFKSKGYESTIVDARYRY